ncbi:diguanylate cyclase [Enterobacter ludwigii]|uniref:sensor domain-containing diguanylate cyclase n=1 Tax=Enterobacter ludwigii TaxID=299767 RepID=UPI003D1A51E2
MNKHMCDRKEEKRLYSLYTMGILDTNTEERFDRLTRIASKLFQVPVALVSLIDRDRQWFKSVCGLDIRSTPRTNSFCAVVVENGRPLVVNDALREPFFSQNRLVLNEPNIRFYAGYPVHLPDGEIAGTICIIDTKPREFSSDEYALLQDLAFIVEDELRIISQATTDALTGLCNRRSFTLIADEILRKSARNNKTFCLIIIDLNDFKLINDTYGHDEGNRALKNFSEILQNTASDNGFIARLGGDEFAVLIPEVSKKEGDTFMAQLNESVKEYNLNHIDYSLGFSGGVAVFDKYKLNSVSLMMKEADREMYLVKKSSG